MLKRFDQELRRPIRMKTMTSAPKRIVAPNKVIASLLKDIKAMSRTATIRISTMLLLLVLILMLKRNNAPTIKSTARSSMSLMTGPHPIE